MKDNVFKPERNIGTTKVDKIKLYGYTGDNTIEELVSALSEKYIKEGRKEINGKSWWIDVKDKAAEKSMSFIDAIYDELEKYLKTKNGK